MNRSRSATETIQGRRDDIVFWYPPNPAYESGYQGLLDCMVTNASNLNLRFEFWYSDDDGSPIGPFVYDLARQ